MNWNLSWPFYNCAQTNPSATALVLDDRPYSYAALWTEAARIGAWLRDKLGDTRGRRVGILASRSLDAYAGILGACAAGATYVPMNPKWPLVRLRAIAEKAAIDALVIDRHATSHGIENILSLSAGPTLFPSAEDLSPASDQVYGARNLATVSLLPEPSQLEANATGYIIFTSGSTGTPKGVMISAKSLRHFLGCMQNIYSVSPLDRVAQFSELSFDFSVLDLFLGWSHGASLWVVPETELMSPISFLQRNALTIWGSVPSVIRFTKELRQLVPNSLPSIRASIFCGETLSAEAAKAWSLATPNGVVDNHYGPTEATVMCVYERYLASSQSKDNEALAIGKAYPGTELAIVEGDSFLEDEMAGELVLSGEQLAQGYLGDAALTAEKFVFLKHPTLGERRWYRTGDLAKRNGKGIYYHLGRIDRQVKVKGYRVELDEVETKLRQLSASDSVAVVAWPIDKGVAGGLIGFIANTSLSLSTITKAMKTELPAYMQLHSIRLMPQLPLNANGKIDRKALCELLELDAKEQQGKRPHP